MKLVAFGDSITKGVFVEEKDNFCTIVGKKLQIKVVNSGVPGNNTNQAKLRLDSDVLAFEPDLVTFEFGMNDHFLIDPTRHQVEPEQFRENMISMVEKVKAFGAKTFILTIHPVIEGNYQEYYYSRHEVSWYQPFGGANKIIELYNRILLDVANFTNSVTIDINKAFQDSLSQGDALDDLLISLKNSSMSDGVHLTYLGHKLYAETIVSVLKSYELQK